MSITENIQNFFKKKIQKSQYIEIAIVCLFKKKMCFCLLDFRHQHFICFLSISLTLVLLCPSFLPWGRFPVPEHLTSTHVMFSSGLCKLNCLEFPSSPWPLEHLGKVTFSVPVSSQRSSCSHSAHHVFTPALFSILAGREDRRDLNEGTVEKSGDGF